MQCLTQHKKSTVNSDHEHVAARLKALGQEAWVLQASKQDVDMMCAKLSAHLLQGLLQFDCCLACCNPVDVCENILSGLRCPVLEV